MFSINLLLRKTAHFSLYAGFFLVLIHGPLEGHPYRAILVCIVAGALDETHQLFLLGRTPSIYDVALDSSGAIFGRFLYSAIFLA